VKIRRNHHYRNRGTVLCLVKSEYPPSNGIGEIIANAVIRTFLDMKSVAVFSLCHGGTLPACTLEDTAALFYCRLSTGKGALFFLEEWSWQRTS